LPIDPLLESSIVSEPLLIIKAIELPFLEGVAWIVHPRRTRVWRYFCADLLWQRDLRLWRRIGLAVDYTSRMTFGILTRSIRLERLSAERRLLLRPSPSRREWDCCEV